MQIRVYYEDTDVGGVVYYANYLKFCERARSEVFFQRETTPYNEEGHFIVRHIDATYFASAKLGDMLDVSTHLVLLKGVSFILFQEITCKGKKLFSMEVELVYVTKEGKVKRLGKEVKKLLEEVF